MTWLPGAVYLGAGVVLGAWLRWAAWPCVVAFRLGQLYERDHPRGKD